ncbi:hypothetical protein DSO57_1011256 [Entomophthora muscae]|uniref:Uncharacterized protein n=1 Tax=Entomophthora muscae TaxID=34485 RepID=A0ACC2RXJ7_9FUNG|nr:hypothetical protein DSO57_1011256 [Entomophthora muscae]
MSFPALSAALTSCQGLGASNIPLPAPESSLTMPMMGTSNSHHKPTLRQTCSAPASTVPAAGQGYLTQAAGLPSPSSAQDQGQPDNLEGGSAQTIQEAY